MSDKNKERLLDLHTDKVLFGLTAEENTELNGLEKLFPELKIGNSMEITTSAIDLTNVKTDEQMPAHLRAKILAYADDFFGNTEQAEETANNVINFQPKLREVAPAVAENHFPQANPAPRSSSAWQWLGWAAAAAACLALALNIWLTGAGNQSPIAKIDPTPQVLSASQQREQMLAENSDIVKAEWIEPNPNQKTGISGDVVWSNSKQKGFIRLRGFPKNDATRETYQLWIIDANQDEKTPVDGGIFNVSDNGEVIIPINAKLNVEKPKMFAVTVEKPGGVVVSKREKLLTIAKVSA